MKGDVKRKFFSSDWSGWFFLASSPCKLNTAILNTRVWPEFFHGRARESSDWVLGKLRGRGDADHGSIGGSRPMAFLGRARGHSVSEETSPPGKTSPIPFLDAHPRGRSSARNFSDPSAGTLPAHPPRKKFLPGRAARFPALSLLHTLGSIAPSFLPETQKQGG